VILLLCIWLTAFVMLLGALFDAEMHPQSARDTTRGPVRPMRKRGAVMADTLGPKP
jgi:membrane protein